MCLFFCLLCLLDLYLILLSAEAVMEALLILIGDLWN